MKNDNQPSFEEYLVLQENSRSIRLQTGSSYKQNHLIRQHLTKVLLNEFKWDFWVTFTFGYDPILEEVEDVLYKLHYRLDRRLVKHIKGKSFLTKEERSEWILFPELGGRGLHYHGFIKFNEHPSLSNSYYKEWHWVKYALENTIPKLTCLLSNGGPIDFRLYERQWASLDELKQILYSMKEFGKGASDTDQDPTFDRFAYTIISHLDWKPGPINQHRSTNKITNIPIRPNKSGPLDLFN